MREKYSGVCAATARHRSSEINSEPKVAFDSMFYTSSTPTKECECGSSPSSPPLMGVSNDVKIWKQKILKEMGV